METPRHAVTLASVIQTSTEVRVRYAETDGMGVVYHSNFLVWFEVGRVHLLDELGLPYSALEASGYRLPVLEAHCEYHQPARFHDIIQIRTSITEKPRIRMRIEYELTCEERLLAAGYTRHAFVNADGKPSRPPKDFIEPFLNHFEASCERQGRTHDRVR